MSELLLHPNTIAQWYRLVSEAHTASSVQLAVTLEHYLVSLLMRFTDKPHLMQNVLALDFLNSAHLLGREREWHLREVGDKCLLLSGLFPQRAARKSLRIGYFVDLGKTAYESVSQQSTDQQNDFYNQLAVGFVSMIDVLLAMRTLANENYWQLTLNQAEEVWQDTGSLYALKILQSVNR